MASAKDWFKKAWKTIGATIGVATTIWLIFHTTYFVTNWLHQEELLKEKVKTVTTQIEELEKIAKKKQKQIDSLESYIEGKKLSYQVGFRVFKQFDQEDGSFSLKKMYRDWDGAWHEVHFDAYYSNMFEIDYYFYVDKETGEKIYVN